MQKLNCIVLTVLALAACNSNPYSPSNRIYKKQAKALSKSLLLNEAGAYSDSSGVSIPSAWVGTVNFNLRKPNYVIIHHTAQKSVEETLKTFTLSKTQVSAHYLIGKDGKIYQLLNDYFRAWHAGVARWGNNSDINSNAIGIELDNDGLGVFSEAQINSLLVLLSQLKKNYNIPAANFIGHADIAPSRKVDPNFTFPWRRLADKGFGLMPDSIITETVPYDFNPIEALKIIGYDTKDLPAAIRAFKRHYLAKENGADLDEEDLKALYNLYCKLYL